MEIIMNFGGVSINRVAVEYIKSILEEDKVVLELGSGMGSTVALGEIYDLYSVENQTEWCNKFSDHTTYINCRSKSYDDVYTKPKEFPLDKAWYHPDDLFPNLPESYDLILVDGPGGHSHGWGRGGFYKHIDKFNTDVTIIFDDVHRAEEGMLLDLVSDYVGRDYEVIEHCTGVILGKSN
jgi:hypothetical protein